MSCARHCPFPKQLLAQSLFAVTHSLVAVLHVWKGRQSAVVLQLDNSFLCKGRSTDEVIEFDLVKL